MLPKDDFLSEDKLIGFSGSPVFTGKHALRVNEHI